MNKICEESYQERCLGGCGMWIFKNYYSVNEYELEKLRKEYPDAIMQRICVSTSYRDYDGILCKDISGFNGQGIVVKMSCQTINHYVLESSIDNSNDY